MIEIKNLTKIYRSGFFLRPKGGIEDLTLRVESNEIFGFLGQNGAGKTTTIKILVGLCYPTSGTAQVMNRSIFQPQVRRLIGYVPEASYFYEYLTPWESLAFYGQLHGLSRKIWAKKREDLLELVGLREAKDKKVKTFSKGMRQRLGLAQALINDPQLVIMDEPTSGLDPLGRQLVKDIIVRLKEEGKTVFFSSHILPDVEAICDRIGFIHQGKLVKEGSLDDLVGTKPSRIEIVAQGVSRDDWKDEKLEILTEGSLLYISVDSEEKKEEIIGKILKKGGRVKYIIPHRPSLEVYFKEVEMKK